MPTAGMIVLTPPIPARAVHLLYGDANTWPTIPTAEMTPSTAGRQRYSVRRCRILSPTSPGSITGGTDILNGGAGNDQLWGGPNDDKFVFNVGSGNDTINDFNQGNSAVGSTATEHDIINVHDYHFADWNTLQAEITEMSSLGMP